MAETVISRTLLRVGEGLVGLIHLLEAYLGGLVAGIAVGVALHRRLPKGGFQLRVGGAAGDAKCLVIIAFGHWFCGGSILGGNLQQGVLKCRASGAAPSGIWLAC